MGCSNGVGSPINSFALVSYLPEPLAGFLDRIRTDLVTECHAKAHVTVLPPRPLGCAAEDAWREILEGLQDFQPFRVELDQIEIFPLTQVVYLSVGAGHAELRSLHQTLNAGCLAFEEPFEYHPHITLAQDLEPSKVSAAVDLAVSRWRDFTGARWFQVDKLTLVQNTLENRWRDLHASLLSTRVTI
jgi:2'-5' RNA ligase